MAANFGRIGENKLTATFIHRTDILKRIEGSQRQCVKIIWRLAMTPLHQIEIW